MGQVSGNIVPPERWSVPTPPSPDKLDASSGKQPAPPVHDAQPTPNPGAPNPAPAMTTHPSKPFVGKPTMPKR